MTSWRLALALTGASVAADQASKQAIRDGLAPNVDSMPLTSFLNIVYLENRGVSFGLFADWLGDSAVAFGAASGLVGFALLLWAIRARHPFETAGFALIAGGAFGNAIDRLRLGAVTDFIDLYVAGWHWPAFNLADVAIAAGVGILLFGGFFWPPKPQIS